MKKLISAALAAAMSLGLAACGQAGASSEEPAPAYSERTAVISSDIIPTKEENESVGFPVTVTDQAGRNIIINEEPQKIASGCDVSTSILIALGAQDRMAGVETNADENTLYKLSAPGLNSLPDIGSAKKFNVEDCAAVEPDLVILPVKLQSESALLVEAGTQVLYVDPESEADVEYMIDMLGQATGTSEKAAELLAFREKNAVTELLAGSEQPSVYMAGSSSVLSAAGGQMDQSDMIAMAGASNAAAELTGSSWTDVSYEQLLGWDPDWIVLASDASYTADDVLQDENLADCTAVKEGHVVQMPNDVEGWDSPVTGSVLGCVWLAGQLHPDAVSQDYVNETAETYYQTFYGFSYAAAAAEKN